MRHLQLFIAICLLLTTACRENPKPESPSPTFISESFLRIDDAPEQLPSWPDRNEIRSHCMSEPDGLHPTNGASATRNEILLYTQQALLHQNFKTGALEPSLLIDLPEISTDQLQFTYEIRDDIFWDNGDPLLAADIEFTLKANLCPFTDNPNSKPFLSDIKSFVIDPQNKKRFTLVMKTANMFNVSFWTDFPIMQKQFHDPENKLSQYAVSDFAKNNPVDKYDPLLLEWANEFNNVKYSRDPVFLNGLGNYKLKSWDAGQEIILEKKSKLNISLANSDHIHTLPNRIIFKVISDPNAIMLELKSQNIDVSTFLNPSALEELNSDAAFTQNYHTAYVPTYNYTFAAMNCKPDGHKRKKIFTDVNVRRAIALLTPVDRLNHIVAQNHGVRLAGPVSPIKSDFNTSLTPVPFFPDSALVLLKNAGWTDTNDDAILDKMIDGERCDLAFEICQYNMTPLWGEMATLMSYEYAKAGIKTTLVALDYHAMIENLNAHNFDMMLGTWGGSSQPEDFTQLWHSSSWSDGGLNYSGFGDEKSDYLIDSIKQCVVESDRKNLSARFQKMVYLQQPYVFLLSSVRRVAIHKRFRNIELYHERPGILLNNLIISKAIQHDNTN